MALEKIAAQTFRAAIAKHRVAGKFFKTFLFQAVTKNIKKMDHKRPLGVTIAAIVSTLLLSEIH